METKLTNLENKGVIGERYIAEKLCALGYEIIFVGGAVKFTIDNSRFFTADFLCYKDGKAFWVQAKYKEPRIKYPDTGLELYRWENLHWLQTQSNISALILFTDNTQKIYGNWIDKLKKEKHGGEFNTQNGQEMIYFWLKDLKEMEQFL